MITTHVLDTAAGRPATGVPVELERAAQESVFGGATEWQLVGSGLTDNDGRQRELTPVGPVGPARTASGSRPPCTSRRAA
jgi:5-hydroxyisourate hydrolase